LTLPKPPDALHAIARHIVWVTNSDPQNLAGRTYGVQARSWPEPGDSDEASLHTLLPADPNPPYGVCEYDDRYYVLQRRKKRNFLGIEKQSVALFQIEIADVARDAAPAPVECLDFDTPILLDVMTATTPIAAPTRGEEKSGLWVGARKKLFRIPRQGRVERFDLDVEPRRLAQTAHGPVFMADRGDHLRIEQRTVNREPRHVLTLPRLPWPAVLIGRGDFLHISVGPAVLRTRLC